MFVYGFFQIDMLCHLKDNRGNTTVSMAATNPTGYNSYSYVFFLQNMIYFFFFLVCFV